MARGRQRVFYIGSGGFLMAVEVKAGNALEASAPKVLFRACNGNQTLRGIEEYYDSSADGNRFLIDCEIPETRQRTINVSIDWLAKFPARP